MTTDPDNPSVEDPSGYNQRRRLESINNSRENVIKAYRDLPYEEIPGYEDNPEWGRMITFRRHVEAFLRDIQQLVRDRGGDSLYTTPIGSITLEPPDELASEGDENPYPIVDGYEPKPVVWQIVGLYPHPDPDIDEELNGVPYVNAPEVFDYEWEVLYDDGDTGLTEGAAVRQPIPWNISMNAYVMGTNFLNRHDFDARLEPSDHRSEEPGV